MRYSELFFCIWSIILAVDYVIEQTIMLQYYQPWGGSSTAHALYILRVLSVFYHNCTCNLPKNKYKNQLKNCVSRDGRVKLYKNKNSRDNDKIHPYISFSSNRVSLKKNVWMHLVCYPYYSCSCTLWPYHPYLHNFLVFYTLLFFFIFYSWSYWAWVVSNSRVVRGVVTKLWPLTETRSLTG